MERNEQGTEQEFVAPATDDERDVMLREVSKQKEAIFRKYEERKEDPEYQAALDRCALVANQRYDGETFAEQFQAETDERGYLLDKEGKPTNVLPRQLGSGHLWGEIVRMANEEFESTHPVEGGETA